MIDDMPSAYQALPAMNVGVNAWESEGQHIALKPTVRDRSWGQEGRGVRGRGGTRGGCRRFARLLICHHITDKAVRKCTAKKGLSVGSSVSLMPGILGKRRQDCCLDS